MGGRGRLETVVGAWRFGDRSIARDEFGCRFDDGLANGTSGGIGDDNTDGTTGRIDDDNADSTTGRIDDGNIDRPDRDQYTTTDRERRVVFASSGDAASIPIGRIRVQYSQWTVTQI